MDGPNSSQHVAVVQVHLICLLLVGVKPCGRQSCGSCAGSMMDDAVQVFKLGNTAVGSD